MTLVGSPQRIVAALIVLLTMAATARAVEVNDYPTSARAEYVFGCLKANGSSARPSRQQARSMISGARRPKPR